MKPWVETLVRDLAKGLATAAAAYWSWYKVKRTWRNSLRRVREVWRQVLLQVSPRGADKLLTKIRDTIYRTKTSSIIETSSTGDLMKTKKKVSFFRVILIIGILVAIAIYILDRLLPKPYSDEELEDAWREGGDEEMPGDDVEAGFQAEQPPAADVTYDVNSEEEGEESEKSAPAESSDEDEGAEKEEDK